MITTLIEQMREWARPEAVTRADWSGIRAGLRDVANDVERSVEITYAIMGQDGRGQENDSWTDLETEADFVRAKKIAERGFPPTEEHGFSQWLRYQIVERETISRPVAEFDPSKRADFSTRTESASTWVSLCTRCRPRTISAN